LGLITFARARFLHRSAHAAAMQMTRATSSTALGANPMR
jgi:hypothetical protein